MSYTLAYQSFGDTTAWHGAVANTDEVYVWRAGLSGADITSADDLAAIVRAAGLAKGSLETLGVSPNFGLDLRGAVVADGSGHIDIVGTSPSWKLFVGSPNASRLGDAILADPSVRQRYPSLAFSDPQWLQLTGPPGAVDFWRSRSVLWDHNLSGPTAAFTARQNLFVGTADDGTGLHLLGGGAPGPGPGPLPDPGVLPAAAGGAMPALWIIGTVAVVWLAASKLWRS